LSAEIANLLSIRFSRTLGPKRESPATSAPPTTPNHLPPKSNSSSAHKLTPRERPPPFLPHPTARKPFSES